MAKRAHGPCSISSCSLLQLTGFASLLLSLYLLFFCLWLIFLLLRPFNHFLFILLKCFSCVLLILPIAFFHHDSHFPSHQDPVFSHLLLAVPNNCPYPAVWFLCCSIFLFLLIPKEPLQHFHLCAHWVSFKLAWCWQQRKVLFGAGPHEVQWEPLVSCFCWALVWSESGINQCSEEVNFDGRGRVMCEACCGRWGDREWTPCRSVGPGLIRCVSKLKEHHADYNRANL